MSPRIVKCRSCGASMVFALSLDEQGALRRKKDNSPRYIPLNPDPADDGNLLVVPRDNGALAVRPLGPTEYADPRKRRTAHFATCPNADKHRRKDPR